MFVRAFGLFFLIICNASVGAQSADEIDDPYFIGVGAGLSSLQSETSSVALTLSEDSDTGIKLFGGYQFDSHWLLEVFYADLGEAEVSAVGAGNVLGTISYTIYGVGGIYQHALNKNFTVFAKGGIGKLDNESNGVPFQRVEDTFIYGGLGIGWNFAGNWDLRAEYEYYDSDAQLISFNIIKRFGSESEEIKRIKLLEKRLAAQEQGTVVAGMVGHGEALDCAKYQALFGTLLFERGSIRLSDAAQKTLSDAVEKLSVVPEGIRFELRGHADAEGTEQFNYILSLSRARNVRDYLADKAIPLSRIDAHGYGEYRPLDSSHTVEGRSKNRRVELVLIGTEKYTSDGKACSENMY